MTEKVRDFVSTYKPKPTPEPFFGFFKEGEYMEKRVFKVNRKPMYARVNAMVKTGQSDQYIMSELNISKRQLYEAKYYYRKYVKSN